MVNYTRPQVISISIKQGALHSECIDSYIEANIAGIMNPKRATDYRMVGIAKNYEEECRIMEKHRHLLNYSESHRESVELGINLW